MANDMSSSTLQHNTFLFFSLSGVETFFVIVGKRHVFYSTKLYLLYQNLWDSFVSSEQPEHPFSQLLLPIFVQ